MTGWITWEFAMDRYKISRFTLELLGAIYPNLCDNKKYLIKNLWQSKHRILRPILDIDRATSGIRKELE